MQEATDIEKQPDIALGDLLQHADFVRRLALRLLGDEQRAADAAQETWLAALAHPSSRHPNLRAWLATIAKNAAFKLLKSDARRQKRECAAARPEAVPSTAELVARAEVRQRVVAAVLALDEPYRSAILYRFYEGLPPRHIAAALGVPLETVRSRLKRGLDLLRGRLAAHFGSRSAWCLALAPLAGLALGAPQAAAAAGGAASAVAPWLANAKTLLSGGLVMTTKVKAALVAAVALSAAFLVWQVAPDGDERTTDSTADQDQVVGTDGEAARGSLAQEAAVAETPSADEAQSLRREPIHPAGVVVAGQVVDMVTGDPVTLYRLHLSASGSQTAPDSSGLPVSVEEVVANPEGRFRLDLARAGRWQLRIQSSSHLEKRDAIEVPEKGLLDAAFVLDPGLVIAGRVVDAETGKPVSGAIVGSRVQTSLVFVLLRDDPWNMPHAVTGADGGFRLSGVHGSDGIAAVHPDYAEGNIRIDIDSESPPEEVEIRLPHGFRVFGTVRDDAGKPAAGIVVYIYGPNIEMPYPVLTEADGSYRLPPAVPGKVTVTANRLYAEHEGGPAFTAETRYAEVVDSDVRVDFGPSEDLITWRGTLFDYDGTPALGVEVSLNPEPFYDHDSPRDYRYLSSTTDQEGRFSFRKMHPWNYAVRIEFPMRVSCIEWGQLELEGKGLFERDIQVSGSVISGVIIDGATGKPLVGCSGSVYVEGHNDDGSPRRYISQLCDSSSFLIRGVLPGEYVVSAAMSGHPRVEVPAPAIGLNEIIENFEVVIPASGALKLRILSAGSQAPRSLELGLWQGQIQGRGREYTFDSLGVFEHEAGLEPGWWKAVIAFEGRGFVEKPFSIAAGKTTAVEIDCADLEFFQGTVTVTGEVVLPDGSPAVKSRVVFIAGWVPGITERGANLQTVTSEEGQFELSGFRPGIWGVQVYLSETMCVSGSRLDIPSSPSDPFPCRITIPPGGTVRGYLVESDTGLRLESNRFRTGGVTISREDGPGFAQDAVGADGSFDIEHVPAGLCRLRVHLREGYEDYESGAFRISAGETVDLGAIAVQRAQAGSIHLEVVDGNGSSVRNVDVEITNDQGFERRTSAGLPNTFDRLPVGVVRLKLSKGGYKPHEEVLDLVPDKPLQVRVVMEKE